MNAPVSAQSKVSEFMLAGLKSRAQAAASVAAQNATAVDAASRFPAEAFAAIKAQSLLGIMAPKRLGGEGVGVADIADICYQLGQSCGSTGMIYAMHQVKMACLVRHLQDSPTLEDIVREICAGQLLLASSTTEGQGGGNVRASEAPIEHHDGEVRLERRATVISYALAADGIVTTARRAADAVATDQVLAVFLKRDYTLARLQGWNTLGMRGTCSEGFTLKAKGRPEQILAEPYETIHTRTMVPHAHLFWGSVWAGIAAGAVGRAQAFVRNAMRQSGGQTPPGAPHFARALASLRTLRGLLASAISQYEAKMNDPQALATLEFQTMITLTKVEASELASQIVLSALRTCGLSGYRSDGDFSVERQLRDVLSAPLMINNERILANLASSSLMSPIPSTISG